MKKVLTIVGGIVVVIAILAVLLFVIVSLTSKKLVCESTEGNITIMYNDKKITGYTSKGVTYDFDGQKLVAQDLGIDQYIKDFSDWFSENTTGTCK